MIHDFKQYYWVPIEGVEENKYMNKIISESNYCYEEHKVVKG